MLGNLKLILGGALAVVIFGGGYSFGARKVAALEAQIQAIKSASDEKASTRCSRTRRPSTPSKRSS